MRTNLWSCILIYRYLFIFSYYLFFLSLALPIVDCTRLYQRSDWSESKAAANPHRTGMCARTVHGALIMLFLNIICLIYLCICTNTCVSLCIIWGECIFCYLIVDMCACMRNHICTRACLFLILSRFVAFCMHVLTMVLCPFTCLCIFI